MSSFQNFCGNFIQLFAKNAFCLIICCLLLLQLFCCVFVLLIGYITGKKFGLYWILIYGLIRCWDELQTVPWRFRHALQGYLENRSTCEIYKSRLLAVLNKLICLNHLGERGRLQHWTGFSQPLSLQNLLFLLEPTSTPQPTLEPVSFPTSLVIAWASKAAVVLIGVSLLIYGIKRK